MFIQTERLVISELTLDDAAFFFELVNDPDWKRYIGDRNIKTIKDAEDYLLNTLVPSYKNWGFGFYKVSLKSSGKSIGISGLVDRKELDHIDIGFAFLPDGRGKGYAFESTKTVLEFAQKELKLNPILAIANSNNKKSHRLLERLGLKFEKKILLPDETKEVCLFSTIV